MKNLTILLFSLCIFSFCSKPKDELAPPNIESKSLTFLHHYYGGTTVLQKTDTAWHRCSIGGEDLKRFETYIKMTSYCDGSNDKLELRIEKACAPGAHENVSL